MRCGLSTACFYPLDTIKALRRVAELGAEVTEVFLNSPSEVEEPYITLLAAEAARGGLRISSVHPYSSSMDAFFFSSDYACRLQDGIDLYRRQFEACQRLGANKLVFHGGRRAPLIKRVKEFPFERYVDHFEALATVGQAYGVSLCQENVAYCMVATTDDVVRMRHTLGTAAFVLDTKQAHRRDEAPALPIFGRQRFYSAGTSQRLFRGRRVSAARPGRF